MKLTAQIICDIIQKGMSLDSDQIWIYNQRRSIPEDKRLYVVIGLLAIKPYGNTARAVESGAGLSDDLSQFMQETLSIDLLSYTTEAIERYAELLGSLRTTYSLQIQDSLALKIAEIPTSINDVSFLEGPALLYRISITLPVLRRYAMIKTAAYYDDFQQASVTLTEK